MGSLHYMYLNNVQYEFYCKKNSNSSWLYMVYLLYVSSYVFQDYYSERNTCHNDYIDMGFLHYVLIYDLYNIFFWESLVSMTALVWLLPCVSSWMTFNIKFWWESLVTLATSVWLLLIWFLKWCSRWALC